MSSHHRSSYTTADEASFIDELGRHSSDGEKLGPLKTVEAYIAAAEKRSNWGAIDGAAAIHYATTKIRELRRNPVEAHGKTFSRSAV